MNDQPPPLKRRSSFVWWVIVLGVSAAFVVVPSCRHNAEYAWEFGKALFGIDPSAEAVEVMPSRLRASYISDNVQATRQWTGKMVVMSGAIASGSFHPERGAQTIDLTDPLDNAMVAMPNRMFIVCRINPESSKQITIDQTRRQIRLVGRCIGIQDFGDRNESAERFVVVTDCRLAK